MASTITLNTTTNVVQNYIRQAPLTGVGGVTNQPALFLGDEVRQFMLAPPFAWRWNRQTITFSLTAGTQDYVETPINPFGWLEKGVVSTVASPVVSTELEVALNLGIETAQNLPNKVAAWFDDDSGDITFRFMPVPDQTYTAVLTYQIAAPTFVNITDTWGPIPDYFSYLYALGFKAMAYEYWNDDRYPFTYQQFLRQVIAANSGLSESQKNIFLDDRLNSAAEQQERLGTSQSGRTGRGGFQG